ncbi:YihY/virulence factor BrkB family protein [Luteimonas pelagia]
MTVRSTVGGPRGRLEQRQRRAARLRGSLPAAVAKRFIELDLLAQSAALAFFALLSLAPLLVLLLWSTTWIYAPAGEALLGQVQAFAGADAARVVRVVLRNANRDPSVSSLAGWWSTGLLLVGATAVFARLQDTLNLIFRTDARRLRGPLAWLRKRLLSFGVVLALGFLLLVATTVSTLLQIVFAGLPSVLPVLGTLASACLYAGTFALMYRYLPDRVVHWRQAVLGGLVTTALFVLGRWAIGVYLATAAPGSAYGSMGALVVLLAWVFFAALVFFLGALITSIIDERARARRIASGNHAGDAASSPAAAPG